MSEDRADDEPAPSDLPEPVRDWLAEIAAERDVPEAELLGRLVTDARGADPADGIEERVDDLEASVDDRLDRLESAFDDKIEDVRERVVQVKRETDGKAPADHAHDDLASGLERAVAEIRELRSTVEALDDRTVRGFENYETVLDYLVEATDDLDRKLDTLAATVVELRDRADDLAEAERRRTAVEELARTANEQGIARAACESCDEPVEIGLLSAPRCPHCEASFSDLVPRPGLLGRDVLLAGTPPALASDAKPSASPDGDRDEPIAGEPLREGAAPVPDATDGREVDPAAPPPENGDGDAATASDNGRDTASGAEESTTAASDDGDETAPEPDGDADADGG